MAGDQQIDRLPGLLAVKMICQQISLSNRLTHQSPTRTDQGRQWRTRAEHNRLKNGPPVMSWLDVHENIDVSDTKLMLSLQVRFISSDFTANKLFPINPESDHGSTEDEPPARGRKPVCIDHRTKAYPCYYIHRWSWLVHNVQPARKNARSKPPQDCQKTKCYARADDLNN